MAFPDASIQNNQILFWIRTIENQMRKRHLATTPTGAYLVQFDNVPVVTNGLRKYVTLPSPVYDISYENGFEYITYQRSDIVAFTQVAFQATSPSASARLYFNPYEEPSPSSPYFYRVKEKVFLLGVENVNVKSVEIGMYVALDPRSSMVDLDDPIELNEEQVHQLRMELLNLGRFIMVIPRDRTETGDDNRMETKATQLKSTMAQADQEEPQE